MPHNKEDQRDCNKENQRERHNTEDQRELDEYLKIWDNDAHVVIRLLLTECNDIGINR